LELIDVIYILIAVVAIYAWWQHMQIREHAGKLAKLACQREKVQLLDGSVSLKKFRLERDKYKRLFLLRYFKFDFSINGTDRHSGIIALTGMQQQYLLMDIPEKATITINEEKNLDSGDDA